MCSLRCGHNRMYQAEQPEYRICFLQMFCCLCGRRLNADRHPVGGACLSACVYKQHLLMSTGQDVSPEILILNWARSSALISHSTGSGSGRMSRYRLRLLILCDTIPRAGRDNHAVTVATQTRKQVGCCVNITDQGDASLAVHYRVSYRARL